jgi:hypothetical protein
MDTCYFCKLESGKLLKDNTLNKTFHTHCLSNEVKFGNTIAIRLAFLLGMNKDLSRDVLLRYIKRAEQIYQDASLGPEDAIARGMLDKADLKHGELYYGFGRRANYAMWNEIEQCFISYDYMFFKMGYFYKSCYEGSFIPMI